MPVTMTLLLAWTTLLPPLYTPRPPPHLYLLLQQLLQDLPFPAYPPPCLEHLRRRQNLRYPRITNYRKCSEILQHLHLSLGRQLQLKLLPTTLLKHQYLQPVTRPVYLLQRHWHLLRGHLHLPGLLQQQIRRPQHPPPSHYSRIHNRNK